MMAETCNWLVLVPTEIERSCLKINSSDGVRVELCGFGPVVAAARTASLIEKLQPKKLLLCGIAGSYSNKIAPGSAYQFCRVACFGVGIGTGQGFKTTSEIGWNQWGGEDAVAIKAELSVEKTASLPAAVTSDLLVSVCAGSASQNDVEIVKCKYPDACAEDMEGFSVASAASLAKVPCHIVRGISNQAGDRNHQNWQIAAAMNSVEVIATHLINEKL